MKDLKNGFTLAETLIAMGIIGIIAMVMMATIKSGPNPNAAMFRKAYNTLSTVVSEMVSTESLYPDGFLYNTDPTAVDIDGVYPSGNTKFCSIFASMVHTVGDLRCNANNPSYSGTPTFTTTDGIAWHMSPNDFSSGSISIKVDVNGDNAPNCSSTANCKKPDRFQMQVYNNGKITIDTDAGKEVMKDYRSVAK